METGLLFNIFIFLAAACVVVSLTARFRLGSVLGYLVAGVLIGPFGLGFIEGPERIMHFAEFGVIMMLFVIGLELEPSVLWRMRKAVLLLGGMQVAVTTFAIMAIGLALGYEWRPSLACGMALSLSSTALVLQMLTEKGLLHTAAGEASFAVLLFQDLAVIPILVILPMLAGADAAPAQETLLSHLPGWQQTLVIAGVIGALITGGHYLSRHFFRFVAKANLREVFTVTALALIAGITLLMQAIGVSPALGAFVAGAVLATSEYRHTLEADIQPFKGLLLGLFFISIGMGMDIGLLLAKPQMIMELLVLLMAGKAVLLYGMGRRFGLAGQGALFAFSLAQGGEFAFVLFQHMSGFNILDAGQVQALTLVVALSMLVTPFMMIANERYVIPRFMSRLPEPEYDEISKNDSPVIIAGYGRFGQIIGRFLKAQGVKVTILEKDPDQVDSIRKFGSKSYFGDASRLDLLESAGAAKARLLVVAVDDADKCLEIVQLARENFPRLKIFARARNRRHAYELHKAGVDYFRRETFDSSLTMAQEVMKLLGAHPETVRYKARMFMQHDEKMLHTSFAFFEKEPELISFTRAATGELERILQEDIVSEKSGAVA